MPVALMYQDRTFKQKTPGLTIKRKILGVWGQSPHEKLMFFYNICVQNMCTDSYEEPK